MRAEPCLQYNANISKRGLATESLKKRDLLVTKTAALARIGSRLQVVIKRRLLKRISRDFKGTQRDTVGRLLASYSGPEKDRARWNILELSKGQIDKIREYVQAAETDYRDVLYRTEFYWDDPLLRSHNPKQIVDEMLAEWGKNHK